MRWYKILTFLIIVLGRIRHRVTLGMWEGLRKDSPLIKDTIPFDELDRKRGVTIECCDCGLEHRFFKEFLFDLGINVLQAWPLRPEGYDYSWRSENYG